MNVDLCIPADHRLADIAVDMVRSAFPTRVIPDSSAHVLDDSPADIVLNFLGSHIFRGEVLNVPNVNFHPAPPEYPGRGGASYALFDGAAQFGATAHGMTRRVDSGPIYYVDRFPITEREGCASLFARSETACLGLLGQTVAHLAEHGKLPPASGERWTGRAASRAEFDAWLILDPADREAFERKISAARHPNFPGPYVYVHGHRFAYTPD